MIIAFYSNYLSHHQLPFAEEMYKNRKCTFYFVSCEPFSKERIELGWKNTIKRPYEIRPYESAEEASFAIKLASECDVMIWGSGSYIYMKIRKKTKKIYFRYSERLFKNGLMHSILSLDYFRFVKLNFSIRSNNAYLLSASAFSPFDYKLSFGKFKKMYKWGYFPETKEYSNLNKLISEKKEHSIIWVGRLIKLKHPEIAILLADNLKKAGYNFKLTLIGDGPLHSSIIKMIEEKNLNNYVRLLGALPSDKVRNCMEKNTFFIFTSDRNEGWGAVLNEAMNSACVVFSSNAIGSTHYLINDGVNGFIYADGDVQSLYNLLRKIFDDKEKCKKVAINAYRSITQEWSAKNASDRFCNLCEQIVFNNANVYYSFGPLSEAKLLIRKKR